MKNNSRSVSVSTEGSAALGQIPRVATPTAERKTPVAAVGMTSDIAAEHHNKLREGASRTLGATDRGGTRLPVEVGSP